MTRAESGPDLRYEMTGGGGGGGSSGGGGTSRMYYSRRCTVTDQNSDGYWWVPGRPGARGVRGPVGRGLYTPLAPWDRDGPSTSDRRGSSGPERGQSLCPRSCTHFLFALGQDRVSRRTAQTGWACSPTRRGASPSLPAGTRAPLLASCVPGPKASQRGCRQGAADGGGPGCIRDCPQRGLAFVPGRRWEVRRAWLRPLNPTSRTVTKSKTARGAGPPACRVARVDVALGFG